MHTVNKLKKFILLPYTFLIPFFAFAQEENQGTITGTVTDQDNSPVEYASVTLLTLPDSAFLGGAQTTTGGKYTLAGIPAGVYVIKVSFVGYRTALVGDVKVQAGQTTNLGKTVIQADAETLDEIVVESEAPRVRYELDKTIFNVSDALKSMSTSATEILEQIPMVQLDEDGVPTAMGQNLTVLIDGKPSRIYGDNIETVLKLIPANMIEDIELITNPSARYRTEEGGIVLNIITKNEYLTGISGMASLSLGTNNEYAPSLNITYSRRKFNFNNSLSFEGDENWMKGSLFRESLQGTSVPYIDQVRDGTDQDVDFGYNGSFMYHLSSKTDIGVFFGFSRDGEEEEETVNTRYLDNNYDLESSYIRYITATEDSWNYRAGLDFDHVFSGSDHRLDVEAYFSTRRDEDHMRYDQQSDWERHVLLQDQTTYSDDEGFTVNVDYVQPFGENSRLEAGLRGDWETDDNEFIPTIFDWEADEFVLEDSLANDFVARERDLAAYAMYRTQIKNFSIQAGLRLENSMLETTMHLRDQYFRNNFLNLIPSLTVSHRLKNKDNIRFSYSRRARPPHWREANPFVDYSDPSNLRQGNPDLKPEFINTFEVGYNRFIEQFDVYANVFYRHSNEPIQWVRYPYAEGVTMTTHENIGREYYYGLETGVGVDVTQGWNIRANMGLRRNAVFGFEEDNFTTAFTAGLNTFFPLFAGFRGYIFADYNGPRSIAQGRMKGYLYMVTGVRKSFMKEDRANISLRLQDVFNARQWSMLLTTPAYIDDTRRQRQSRYLTLTFSYTFGKLAGEKKENGRGGPEEDFEGGDEF